MFEVLSRPDDPFHAHDPCDMGDAHMGLGVLAAFCFVGLDWQRTQ